jgi:hypothetical protein
MKTRLLKTAFFLFGMVAAGPVLAETGVVSPTDVSDRDRGGELSLAPAGATSCRFLAAMPRAAEDQSRRGTQAPARGAQAGAAR